MLVLSYALRLAWPVKLKFTRRPAEYPVVTLRRRPALPASNTIRLANNKQQILASIKAEPSHLGTRMRLSELCFGTGTETGLELELGLARQPEQWQQPAQHHPQQSHHICACLPRLRSAPFNLLHCRACAAGFVCFSACYCCWIIGKAL